MNIHKFPFGPLKANMYIIETDLGCVIIDPCVPSRELPEYKAPFISIIVTHGHFDHIICLEDIRNHFNIPVYAHKDEFPLFIDSKLNGSVYYSSNGNFRAPDYEVNTEVRMTLDPDTYLKFIHTPGHSPGGICILLVYRDKQTALFSGDTLFKGNIGRTDLGGDMNMMKESLRKLAELDDEVIVYSGHGSDSSIGWEKAHNKYLMRL